MVLRLFPHRKYLLWVTALILGITAFLILKIVTRQVIDDFLTSTVIMESNGLYSIEYDRFHLNPFTRRLELVDFHLKLDSANKNATEAFASRRNLYEVSVPNLLIELKDVGSIYTRRSLRIAAIYIDQPHLRMYHHPENEQTSKLTLESGNLYQLISKYLDMLKINKFGVRGAEVGFKEISGETLRQLHLQDISFLIENFLLDSAAAEDKTKIFYSDNLTFSIANQTYHFPDGVHVLAFDALQISTRESEIRFKNFRMYPQQQAPRPTDSTLNIYQISIPEFKIKGLDFKKAYNENKLLINRILLDTPSVTMYRLKSLPQDVPETKPDNSLLASITDLFDLVGIDTFALRHGNFALTLPHRKRHIMEKIDLEYYDYRIDPNIVKQGGFLPQYNNIDLRLKGYRYDLRDSSKTLMVESLDLSTNKASLSVDDLDLYWNETKGSAIKPWSINDKIPNRVSVESIYMRGFDTEAVMENREFEADTLMLTHPLVQLSARSSTPPLRPDQSNLDLENLYPFVRDFATAIGIGYFETINATVQLGGRSSLDHDMEIKDLSFQLKDFLLDELASERNSFLHSEEATLRLEDANIKLPELGHVITADQLMLSSEAGILDGRNLAIQPLEFAPNRPELMIKFYDDHLRITKLDFKDLLHYNIYEFDTLYWENPKFEIHRRVDSLSQVVMPEKKPTPLSRWVTALKADHLQLTDAEFVWKQNEEILWRFENANLILQGMEADSVRLLDNEFILKSDRYQYAVQDLYIPLKDQIHELSIDSLSISSTDSTAWITNLTVQPMVGLNEGIDVIHAQIPNIQVSGADPKVGSFTQTADFGQTIISQPKIYWRLYPTANSAREDFAFPEQLPRNFLSGLIDTITARSLKIDEGEIRLEIIDDRGSQQYQLSALNAELEDFIIGYDIPFHPDRFMYTASTQLQARDISQSFSFKDDSLYLNAIAFDSRHEILNVSNAYLHVPSETPGTESGGASRPEISLSLPDLEITGINLSALYHFQELHIDNVQLMEPSLSIYGNGEKTPIPGLAQARPDREKAKTIKKIKWFEIPTQIKLDTNIIRAIHITSLGLNNTKISINSYEQDQELKPFDLDLDGIHFVAGNVADHQNVLFTDDIHFQIRDVDFPIDEELYQLHCDQIDISTKDRNAALKGIQVTSPVDKYEFGPLKGQQVDFVQIPSGNILLSGIDYYAFFYDNKIHVNKITLDQIDASLFRDRRVPVDRAIKPTLTEMVQRIPFSFTADTVAVQNSKIAYEEIPETGEKSGKIHITDITGAVTHMSNDSLNLNRDTTMVVKLQGNLFDAATLEIEIFFDLRATDGSFVYNAHLSPIDLTAFNQFVENVLFFNVVSGNLNFLSLQAEGNNVYTAGAMEFYYQNLHLAIANKKDREIKGFGSNLASFVANTLVKKNNYPFPVRKKRLIYSEKDPYKSTINYLVKIILSGVESNIGIRSHRKQIHKLHNDALNARLDAMTARDRQ